MCNHRDKEELKGTKDTQNSCYFIQEPSNKSASSGVAILLKQHSKNCVHSYTFINNRIINLRLETSSCYMNIVGNCVPEEGRKDKSPEFYKTLQTHMKIINK